MNLNNVMMENPNLKRGMVFAPYLDPPIYDCIPLKAKFISSIARMQHYYGLLTCLFPRHMRVLASA